MKAAKAAEGSLDAAKDASVAAQKSADAANKAAVAAEVASGQLDVWRKREASLIFLRWAVDKALDSDPVVSDSGYAILDALPDSTLVQHEDVNFLQQVKLGLLASATQEVEEAEEVTTTPDEPLRS